MDAPEMTRRDGDAAAAGRRIADHWARRLPGYDTAVAMLRRKGIDPEHAAPADLHLFDMVHVGGVEAVDTLAGQCGMEPGHRVLDIGCGLGGPARRFADHFGARVWGVELSPSVAEAAAALTALLNMAKAVRLEPGDAVDLPYPGGMFDIAVMQHCALQVPDKVALFGEGARVLKPGGILGLHEFFAGPGGAPLYPVVWGDDPAMSALQSPEAARRDLARAGFDAGEFQDQSPSARRFYERLAEKMAQKEQRAGGAGGGADPASANRRIFGNMVQNLSDGRLRMGMLICRKIATR